MPLWTYQCTACGKTLDRLFLRPGIKIPDLVDCSSCGQPARRRYGEVSVIPDFPEPMYHLGMGEVISSRKQLRILRKQQGVEEIGTDLSREVRERREALRESRKLPSEKGQWW